MVKEHDIQVAPERVPRNAECSVKCISIHAGDWRDAGGTCWLLLAHILEQQTPRVPWMYRPVYKRSLVTKGYVPWNRGAEY